MNQYLNRSYAGGSDTNSIFSDNLNHPSNSTSMSSVSILDQASSHGHGLKNRPSYLSLNTTHSTFSLPPKLNLSQISLHSNSSSLQTISPTSVTSVTAPTVSEMSPIKTLNELLLKSNLTVKLHLQDHIEKEWIPLSMSRMNIFAVLSNEDFFRFDINLSNPTTTQLKKIDTIVNKKGLSKVGKTGLQFEIVNDVGELKKYLIEFRNSIECQDIYTMLSC
ncbi:hypothetical protein WICPIJ_005059 [Wickerhamomyces pijperi]|uniref:Uncharacterized protein n=1 Tax=Wickerhamomyces pijperi TaxID=599730 RepID=A0A9P8Q6Z6_WICPI|nr:hypothetical protein WICPIJ_005059 [Wickerhamomyces pijperi]